MAAPGRVAQWINGWIRRVPAWSIYGLGFAYMAWLLWRGATDFIPVEPIDWIDRSYGITALQLLVSTLALTAPSQKVMGQRTL